MKGTKLYVDGILYWSNFCVRNKWLAFEHKDYENRDYSYQNKTIPPN